MNGHNTIQAPSIDAEGLLSRIWRAAPDSTGRNQILRALGRYASWMNPYVTGLFALGGVLLGALLTPLTQLGLEMVREKRVAKRTKRVVAAELLHVQLMLKSASGLSNWPQFSDMDTFLPTSVWRENRLTLATNVDDELFEKLTLAYASLEADREAFAIVNQIPGSRALSEGEALTFKITSYKLGQLRRKLVPGASWLGIDEVEYANAARISEAAEDFYRLLEQYTDDMLRNADTLAKVKKAGADLGQLATENGDGGTLLGQINDRIDQRLANFRAS